MASRVSYILAWVLKSSFLCLAHLSFVHVLANHVVRLDSASNNLRPVFNRQGNTTNKQRDDH
ncbi:hypothetical protein HBI80_050300 [Parastagonospora nodorum]|nr:hypothetical protein HBI80_050300 [Parastagonospora nodorum]